MSTKVGVFEETGDVVEWKNLIESRGKAILITESIEYLQFCKNLNLKAGKI